MRAAAGENVFTVNQLYPIRIYLNQWDGVNAAQTLSDSLKPVSYTHLDVYKRQGMDHNSMDTSI